MLPTLLVFFWHVRVRAALSVCLLGFTFKCLGRKKRSREPTHQEGRVVVGGGGGPGAGGRGRRRQLSLPRWTSHISCVHVNTFAHTCVRLPEQVWGGGPLGASSRAQVEDDQSICVSHVISIYLNIVFTYMTSQRKTLLCPDFITKCRNKTNAFWSFGGSGFFPPFMWA